MDQDMQAEAKRLEGLWAGEFGKAYLERNIRAGEGRDVFWNAFLAKHRPQNVLEIGCNVGGNLRWIAPAMEAGPEAAFGIDIGRDALKTLKSLMPGVNAIWSSAKNLPFRDRWFDLVFTAGVLIHQPEESLLQVMSEAVRCSRRYVLCLEYFSPQTVEVPYRGETGALFKRDYGKLYQENFPDLKLVEKGFLGEAEGWDNVTSWLFERRPSAENI